MPRIMHTPNLIPATMCFRIKVGGGTIIVMATIAEVIIALDDECRRVL